MRHSENRILWFVIILLLLCTQIHAKGGTLSHFNKKKYLPPEFVKTINAPDFDAEAFRSTIQDPKLETYRSYKGNGSRYIKARNAKNGLNGKAFEAITQSKFNHYAKSIPELRNYKIVSSAHFEKVFNKSADRVVDLMLVDISNPRMPIIDKYQLKFSFDEAKKALKNPKYKNTKIVVPSDVYKEMSRKTQFSKAIKEGRLCRDIIGVEVPETRYVKKLARDYMQEIFTDLNELEASASKALTSEAIARSSKNVSKKYVSKLASQLGVDIVHQTDVAANRALINSHEIIRTTRTAPTLREITNFKVSAIQRAIPKRGWLNISTRVIGKTLIISDIVISEYLIVNDIKEYNSGKYDTDIFIGKTVLHSASLATGIAFLCAPEATFTKIAGVAVIVVGIPTELGLDYIQNTRLKKQLAALNSQEQHNAIRNSLIESVNKSL